MHERTRRKSQCSTAPSVAQAKYLTRLMGRSMIEAANIPEDEMNPSVKKWLNRSGLVAVIAGIVLIVVGGGDAGAAIDTAGTVAAIAGSVLVLIREVLG